MKTAAIYDSSSPEAQEAQAQQDTTPSDEETHVQGAVS